MQPNGMAILQVKTSIAYSNRVWILKKNYKIGDEMPGEILTVICAVVILIVGIIIEKKLEKITIFEYENGVRFHKGKIKDVVGPGVYKYFNFSTRFRVFDMRQTIMQINGQELLSADKASIKISLAVKYQITDPKAIILNYEDYLGYLYMTIQLKVREVVSAIELEEILANRKSICDQLKVLLTEDTSESGFSIHAVDLKDIMLSGELKKVFAEAIKVKKEALISLEKARGETATLRSLANAAQMMRKNPELTQLRLIHTMESSQGNTYVMDTNFRAHGEQ